MLIRTGLIMATSAAGLSAALSIFGPSILGDLPPTAPAAVSPRPAGASTSTRVYLTSGQISAAQAAGGWPTPLRSLLNQRRPLRYGEYKWDEHGAHSGPVFVRVDLANQIISAFRSGDEIGTAAVLYGADQYQTPLGRFPILAKARVHRSATYDAPMPYTLRLTSDGVSIHGSDGDTGVDR